MGSNDKGRTPPAKTAPPTELILFNVSDLQEAGIDWQNAPPGVETPCRFWAYWTASDKTKSSGNPYINVTRLEPCDPSTANNDDLEAIPGELRAIKALLTQILRSNDFSRSPASPPTDEAALN